MKNKYIPELRFKGFTEDWKHRKLGEKMYIKSRIGWQRLTKDEQLLTGDYYLITGTDIDELNHVIDFSRSVYVSKERYEKDQNIQVENGDIILTKDGTIGKVAMVRDLDKPATLNSHLFVLRDLSSEVNNQFLLYVLDSHLFKRFVEATKTGSTLTGLPQKTLVEFTYYLPCIDEQKKIANFFKQLDDTIAIQQQELDTLKQTKQGFLQKMFPKEGETVPEVRFPGFSGEWGKKKIKDLCSISTGKGNTQDKIEDGIYPFYVRSATIERSNDYLYDQEAVLTVGDGVGTGKVFHYVNGKYNLHQRVYRMYDFKDGLIAKFFYYYFSNHFYRRVMAMTAKTSVDSVRMDMIAEMQISYPCLKEQLKMVNLLDDLESSIIFNQQELDALKQTKKAFLQKMFVNLRREEGRKDGYNQTYG